jgi:hypothetical protein
MDKMVRITICIEPETERLLRLLGRRNDRSISELVREAVEHYWVKGHLSAENEAAPAQADLSLPDTGEAPE